MLSLYHDGELPSPWKEKLESHLGECSDCRERLERFRRLSDVLGEPADFSIGPVRDRVWQRLFSPVAPQRSWPQPIWNRSVRVPLPLLLAAAALVLVLGVFFVRIPRTAAPAAPVLSALGTQTVVPVTDLNGIWQYLGNDDSGDIVIIRLPESRSFNSHGEPAIIRAADYGGGKGTR
ncbi:MAG: zf-HC2 domain-containing protein [Treponema sp.]|jgi:anti-sigma factor RsiW|nr:zf-HC2 domain-containing protein [Treponema sp.]